jgi:hypothetical protein
MLTRDDIVKKLGIENLTAAEQDDQLQELSEAVSSRLLQKLTEKLTNENIEKLSTLIDDSKDEEVEAFLRSKIDNYDNWNEIIELETIDELESNRKAIVTEIKAIDSTKVSTE